MNGVRESFAGPLVKSTYVKLTGNARPVLLKNYAGLPATRTERRLLAHVDCFRMAKRPGTVTFGRPDFNGASRKLSRPDSVLTHCCRTPMTERLASEGSECLSSVVGRRDGCIRD